MTKTKSYGGGPEIPVVLENEYGTVSLELRDHDGRKSALVWAELATSYRDGYAPSTQCWSCDTLASPPWWKWWTVGLPAALREAIVWLEQTDALERKRVADSHEIIQAVTSGLDMIS